MKQPYAFHFGMGVCSGETREVQGGNLPSTFHLPLSTRARQSRHAFTLIELLGVMAIIGILAAVTLPSMISRIETANTAKEDANQEEIARALVEGIKAAGMIPNPTVANGVAGSWTAIASNYSNLGPTALASVLPASNDRQVILSGNLATYVAANGYSTPASGWPDPLPSDLKIYILASSKNGLPLQASIPVADIESWTKVFDSNTGTVTVAASVFGSANTAKGEFLHVRAIDLRQVFCRISLIDTACPPTATISGGGGYANGDVITFNVGSYPFSFTAPGNSFGGQSGNLAGNPPQMLTKPFSSSTTIDPGSGSRISGTSSGVGAIATLSSTPSPQFQINSLSAQAFGTGNTMVFYVLKGTSLSLLSNSGSTLLTVTVQGESTFKYFNGTWARID
jgi:prepilin-type N-terminal cleavage/methylation domain-containing protein